jgi:hypothetical protein
VSSGATEVAAREARAAEVDLARHPDGNGGSSRVEHIHLRVGDRAAQGGRAAAAADEGVGGVGGVLGGAVEVVEFFDLGFSVDLLGERREQGLAGEAEGLDRRGQGAFVQQLGGGRGDGVDERDLGSGGQAGEREGVGRDDQRGAGGEREEDLEDREIEAQGGGEEHSLDLGAGEDRLGPRDEANGALVLDGHAFGATGGAGGEEHVREVPRRHAALDTAGGPSRELGRGERNARDGRVREEGGLRLAGDEHASPGVVEDLREAGAREGRVEGDVRATCFENAEHADEEIGVALRGEPHHDLGAHTLLTERVREAIGTLVQLSIAEAGETVDDGGGLGATIDLGLEERVKAAGRDGGGRLIPRDRDAMALFGVEER